MKRTHCKQGHEFSVENTYYYPDGSRGCKICRAKGRKERRESKESNLDEQKGYLLNTDGITVEQYNEMFKAQEGKCLICDRHEMEFKRRLSIDHNHETGEVRGLLCTNCNSMLGHARDNIKTLEKAIEYLKKYE